MKKILCLLAMIVAMMMSLCACSSESKDEQLVIEGHEIFYEVERGDRVEDEAMIALVRELLVEENDFYFKMSCDWVDSIDQSQQYEMDGGIYFPVIEEGISSWSDYEDMARSYYTESYIQDEFTPYYVPHVYREDDGKLYRAMADGIGNSLIEDSVEVYEREDGLYYVTVLTNSDMEGSKNTYILEKVGEGKHMFRIVAKTGLL